MTGPTLIDLERVDASKGAAVVAKYLRNKQAVIFEGLIDQWPARKKWSLEWFADTLKDTEIHLAQFTRSASVSTSMPAFVDWLKGARDQELGAFDDLYLAWDVNVLKQQPSLLNDINFEAVFPKRSGFMYQALWIGGENSHTPLHHDMDFPNLHACIRGEKRFILFAPDQRAYLYPSNIYEWTSEFSAVDFCQPDLERFPEVSKARGYEAILGEGDVLFIPGLWWHGTWCMSPSISVNAWPFSPRSMLSPGMMREFGKAALHKLGLYASNRCTCCGHGDLRRHLNWSAIEKEGESEKA